jgi:hypothetical protein
MHDESLSTFIDRWTESGGAERAEYLHLPVERCDALDADAGVLDRRLDTL